MWNIGQPRISGQTNTVLSDSEFTVRVGGSHLAGGPTDDGGGDIECAGAYDLSWWTVDGGGWTFGTGRDYSLGGTMGKADAGSMRGGNYTMLGGFWGRLARAPRATTCPPCSRTIPEGN
jgi:hypothetical protein